MRLVARHVATLKQGTAAGAGKMIYMDDAAVPYKRTFLCHLFCDGDAGELHKFAERLGLRRAHFNGRYYNMGYTMRARALGMGATAVTHKQAIEMWKATKNP